MKRNTTLFSAAALVLVVAVIAAGCGSSTSGSPSGGLYGSTGTASAPTGSAGAAKVGSANTSLGRIVVDTTGRTLYLFLLDKQPGQTNGEGSQDFGAGWDALSQAGNKIESTG